MNKLERQSHKYYDSLLDTQMSYTADHLQEAMLASVNSAKRSCLATVRLWAAAPSSNSSKS